ncbi:MAG: cupin domain-containing protein [Clostridiales bacterium]|nr:cupin domain-containing protein [Clostridiales bacterium]MCF8021272.1 cupin domain-containing protein [Clostridiales bacterium]
MEITNMNEVETYTTPRGVQGRKLVNLDGLVVINLLLKPGEEVPGHKTPVNVLFQVIQGEGKLTIGEESEQVHAGDFIYSPRNIPHALEANKGSEFYVLVFKLPQ